MVRHDPLVNNTLKKKARRRLDPTKKSLRMDEVKRAIQRSGYPLELRLVKQLKDAGLVASTGDRISFGDHSREIDVVGSIRELRELSLSSGKPLNVVVNVQLLIEAKGLERGAAFVALTTTGAPPPHILTQYRYYWGGMPSFGVVHPVEAEALRLFAGAGREAFLALCQGTVAFQWTLARRKKDGDPFADQDENFSRGIDNIVRAAFVGTVRNAHQTRTPDCLHVDIAVPVLALATRLMVYDTITESLVRASRVMLARQFEVAPGRNQRRLLDIVTEEEVASFADSYRRAAVDLADRLAKMGDALLATAESQAQLNAQKMLDGA